MKLMPHTHHEDRVYTVISGIFYIGLGDQFNADKLEAHPPGSVIVLPGDTPHFHWAKSGEYVTQVAAIGPISLEYVQSRGRSAEEEVLVAAQLFAAAHRVRKVAGRFVQVAIGPDWRAFRRNDPVGHPIRGDSYRIVGNPAAIQKGIWEATVRSLRRIVSQPEVIRFNVCSVLSANAAAPFRRAPSPGDRTPWGSAPHLVTQSGRTLLRQKPPQDGGLFLWRDPSLFFSCSLRYRRAERSLHFQPRHENVLVQPEMEIGRFPLSSIPPSGAGFSSQGLRIPTRIWKPRKEQVEALPFIVSMSPQAIPRHRRVPPDPAPVSPGKSPCGFTTTSIGLN